MQVSHHAGHFPSFPSEASHKLPHLQLADTSAYPIPALLSTATSPKSHQKQPGTSCYQPTYACQPTTQRHKNHN